MYSQLELRVFDIRFLLIVLYSYIVIEIPSCRVIASSCTVYCKYMYEIETCCILMSMFRFIHIVNSSISIRQLPNCENCECVSAAKSPLDTKLCFRPGPAGAAEGLANGAGHGAGSRGVILWRCSVARRLWHPLLARCPFRAAEATREDSSSEVSRCG